MKIFDMRIRPPFRSICEGMFNNPGRELFEPESFARRFGMTIGESARQKSMDLFIREMDEAGIVAGAVLIRKSTGMDNADLEELNRLWPGRFVGVAGIDPHDAGALDEIDRFVLRGTARAVLVEPGFCRPALRADDRAVYPIYEKCQAKNIPVFISFGGFVAPDLSYTDPMIIERVAMDFPKLKLVIAHGGWPNVGGICHVAFDKKPLTRRERAENVKKKDFLNKYSGAARMVLEALLDKYMNTGIYEIEKTEILRLDPFMQMGKPQKIASYFGGKDGYLKAVKELEQAIYDGGAA